jgi:hypothetical protein
VSYKVEYLIPLGRKQNTQYLLELRHYKYKWAENCTILLIVPQLEPKIRPETM